MKRVWSIILVAMLALICIGCGTQDNSGGEDIVTSVDSECLSIISGEYQASGIYDAENDEYVDAFWHLTILEDNEGEGPYFTIYDNEAGNPGVEGRLIFLDDKTIKVLVDEEYYEQLPSDKWELDGDTLTVDYAMTELGIVLYNNNVEVGFRWE